MVKSAWKIVRSAAFYPAITTHHSCRPRDRGGRSFYFRNYLAFFREPTAPAFGHFQPTPAHQCFEKVFRVGAIAFKRKSAEHETPPVIRLPERPALTPLPRNGGKAPVVSAD